MNYWKIFCALGFIGVSLGAFGAHYLSTRVSPFFLESWKTATLYLFIHSLLGLLSTFKARRSRSSLCLCLGIIFFSGPLYAIVLTHCSKFGALAPVGGCFLLFGWFFLFWDYKT